jgi:hypothetical protein
MATVVLKPGLTGRSPESRRSAEPDGAGAVPGQPARAARPAARARRRAPGLPLEEAELLLKINRGIPPETRARYDELVAKREAETLTPEEHEELLGLVEQVESLQAERVEHLTRLTRLRGISLGALMDDLGIRRTDHG